MTVSIEEATAHLARLIEKAASGEEIYITRDSASAIRLMPVDMSEDEHSQLSQVARVPGLGKGQVWIAPDFDGSMPEDWLDEFYNGEIFPCEA